MPVCTVYYPNLRKTVGSEPRLHFGAGWGGGRGTGGVKQAERNWRTRAFAPQVLDCEAKSSRHMRSHVCVSLSSSLPLSLFSGSRTEQDKTQPIVTLVETAHALFTGGSPFFRRQCVINAALNAFFLFIYLLFILSPLSLHPARSS